MAENIRTFQVGAAKITLINVGDFQGKLAEWIDIPEHERPADYAALFERVMRFPGQCVLIQLPNTTVLVDASVYDTTHSLAIPNYQPPPSLLTRLPELGVKQSEIAHVVITHAHFDHFNGVTQETDGRYVPCFPNARHYLGSADWENTEMQNALQDRGTLESRTLGILQKMKLLELVTEKCSLVSEIQVIPAPGETPGHQIVRVCSEGQTLYCLGDLYHHPIEVERPEWLVNWANPITSLNSRRVLHDAALAENALLVATHIPTVGRLGRSTTGVTWNAVD